MESIGYKGEMIRLSDEQWERIRKHFPEEHIAEDRPGRKPVPTRQVLEAMRFVNRHAKVYWKATPLFLQKLADAERDAEDDLGDIP